MTRLHNAGAKHTERTNPLQNALSAILLARNSPRELRAGHFWKTFGYYHWGQLTNEQIPVVYLEKIRISVDLPGGSPVATIILYAMFTLATPVAILVLFYKKIDGVGGVSTDGNRELRIFVSNIILPFGVSHIISSQVHPEFTPLTWIVTLAVIVGLLNYRPARLS